MRWSEPRNGDTRQRTRFLLFPKTIRHETRWLERATWTQRLDAGYHPLIGGWVFWIDERWG